MLSAKLIQLIESHWEPITARVMRQIRNDRRLPEIGRLPELELRERAQDILEHLGDWLAAEHQGELARRYERLGQVRCEETIPLQEVVLAHLIIKNEMIDFVHEQGVEQGPLSMYAEEELERRVDRFFDHAIYHVVRGYEQALRQTMAAKAAAAAHRS